METSELLVCHTALSPNPKPSPTRCRLGLFRLRRRGLLRLQAADCGGVMSSPTEARRVRVDSFLMTSMLFVQQLWAVPVASRQFRFGHKWRTIGGIGVLN